MATALRCRWAATASGISDNIAAANNSYMAPAFWIKHCFTLGHNALLP